MADRTGQTTWLKRGREQDFHFILTLVVALAQNTDGLNDSAVLIRRFSSMSTPPSVEHIEHVAVGFIASKVLFSAIELGLFTELAKRPLDANEIQARLKLHPRSVRDFLNALVALGMLERSGNLYANTPETDFYLDRAKRSYIGGLHEMFNGRLYNFLGLWQKGSGRASHKTRAKPVAISLPSFLGTRMVWAGPARNDRSFLSVGNQRRKEASMDEVQDFHSHRHGRRMPARTGRAG